MFFPKFPKLFCKVFLISRADWYFKYFKYFQEFTFTKLEIRGKAFHHVFNSFLSQQPECHLAGRQPRPYHITDWNSTRVLSVSEVHGSHTACPVIREEIVPARILKQALSSPGTHHITTLPQQFIDTRPSALVFTASVHCVDEMSSSDFGGEWEEKEEEVVGDQVTCHIPVLPQWDYVGHTLLWLIKNSGWRDLLHSLEAWKIFYYK